MTPPAFSKNTTGGFETFRKRGKLGASRVFLRHCPQGARFSPCGNDTISSFIFFFGGGRGVDLSLWLHRWCCLSNHKKTYGLREAQKEIWNRLKQLGRRVWPTQKPNKEQVEQSNQPTNKTDQTKQNPSKEPQRKPPALDDRKKKERQT